MKPEVGQRLRVGMVMPGSVKRTDPNTLQVSFKIYDARGANRRDLTSILPDPVPQAGVVAQGVLGEQRGQRAQCWPSTTKYTRGSGRRDERESEAGRAYNAPQAGDKS